MILEMMLYAVGVGAALSLMGYCQERLAFMRNLPRRWVWPVMMVLCVVWVAGAMLLARPTPGAAPVLELVVTPSGELDVAAVAAPESSAAPVAGAGAALTDRPPTRTPWTLPSDRTLLLAWAALSALLMLSLAVAGALLRKRSAKWRRARVRGREVMVSDSVGPALMGTWQPRIVVPEWFMTETAARQELILQHEDQHIAARDPLLLRAAVLFALAVPWNLPLWWQLRRMRRAIELDCDARVLRQGVSPVEYGAVLLAVTRRCASVPPGLIAMSDSASALEIRVRHLLPDPARHSMWRAIAAMLLWMVGIGAAVALQAPALPQRGRQAVPLLPGTGAPDAILAWVEAAAAAGPVAAAAAVPGAAPSRQPGTTALPRLLPPTFTASSGDRSRDRRDAIEAAIVAHHPVLVNGPERDGQAFVSMQLRADGSVESSELKYVEAGDTAALAAASAAASAAYLEPFSGQLLLARGWQIAGDATVKTQTRVSYGTRQDPAAMRQQQQAWESERAELVQVVEHHLAGAMTDPATGKRGAAYLIVSNDGQVLKAGYLGGDANHASLGSLQEVMPGQRLTRFSVMPRFLGTGASRATLVIAWVQP